MKSTFFLSVFLFMSSYMVGQRTSDYYSLVKSNIEQNYGAYQNSAANGELQKDAIAYSLQRSVREMLNLLKSNAGKEDILNVVYSDPTLGQFVKNESDLIALLGISESSFNRMITSLTKSHSFPK
mgnify:CR=1 FL=1